MEKDFIQKRIEEILHEIEEEGLFLHEGEVNKLAHLLSSVIKSELGVRLMFYEEVNGISKIIEQRLEKQKKEIMDCLLGNGKSEIWH